MVNQAFNLRLDDAGRFRVSTPSGEISENTLLHRETLTLDFENGRKLICRWQTAEGSPEMLADLARELLHGLRNYRGRCGALLTCLLSGPIELLIEIMDPAPNDEDR